VSTQEGPVWTGVDSASRRRRRATTPLSQQRRVNWRHVAAPRAWQAFGELRLKLREPSLPSQFFVQHVQTPNEAVIQIRASQTKPACSTERITRHGTPPYVDTAIRTLRRPRSLQRLVGEPCHAADNQVRCQGVGQDARARRCAYVRAGARACCQRHQRIGYGTRINNWRRWAYLPTAVVAPCNMLSVSTKVFGAVAERLGRDLAGRGSQMRLIQRMFAALPEGCASMATNSSGGTHQ
jgi:hypothetical protein